jgi:hypothetical protein
MEHMLIAVHCKITSKQREKKKLNEIQMCLSLKGTTNHLGWK